jgi:spermidine synthase
VGAFCLTVPTLFGLLTQFYVALYQRLHLGPLGLTAMRMGCAAVMVLLPAFLMGGTLPVIARYLAARKPDFQPDLDGFYAANTLGGASGVLLSTYFLMPWFGIWGTVLLACAINFMIFLVVTLLPAENLNGEFRRSSNLGVGESRAETIPPGDRSGLLLAGSFFTGAIALAYEVTWTHALSFLIGNTVYAFGLMLFTLLSGLGLGARVVARHYGRESLWPQNLALSQVLLGLTVFVTLPLWIRVPVLFEHGVNGAYNYDLGLIAALLMLRIAYLYWANRRRTSRRALPWFRQYEAHLEGLAFFVLAVVIIPFVRRFDATYFVAGELLRFLCVFGLLIAPALLLGLSFPLLLNLYTRNTQLPGKRVGGIYAANTLGTVLGSLVTGFVLLPYFGSFATLRGCAAANILLGLGFALGFLRMTPARRWAFSIAGGLIAILFLVAPGRWDMSRVTGTYAYFGAGWSGQRLLFLKEDVQGGLTSVVQSGAVRTLLSNGKFQGDNASQIGPQTRFAIIPALFVQKFERALVIGLGTGNTLRAVARFPFRQIDVAELSPKLVEAAREWFGDVNDRVFDHDPRVALSIADGRNFLLLSRQRYDMITIEVTSLWISGEADLYNKEFYELCRDHLAQDGVLQQWVALHHLRDQDLLVVLNTAAQVFPHVAFFQSPDEGHGFLIASSSPLGLDYRLITGFDEDPGEQRELKELGIPSFWSLLGELTLYDSSFRRATALLPRLAGLRPDFVSTDFRPYLEYQVPKGITIPHNTTIPNAMLLQDFRDPDLPPDLNIRNLPSDNERNLILGYVAEKRGDLAGARARFLRVEGPTRLRAQEEIARINSTMQTAH